MLLAILLVTLTSLSFAQQTISGIVYLDSDLYNEATLCQVTSFPGITRDFLAKVHVSTTGAVRIDGYCLDGSANQLCPVIANVSGATASGWYQVGYDDTTLPYGYIVMAIEATNTNVYSSSCWYQIGEKALGEGDD